MFKQGKWLYIFLACALLFGVDFLSKAWTNAHLPIMSSAYPAFPYGGIPVFKNFLGIEFSISHLTNRGAAWGVLGEYQGLLIIARFFLIAGMIIYLFFYNRELAWRFPLALVITGAIGNIVDYFIYGHVVDMLHFVLWGYDFPVFNVADSAVTVGICWLLLVSSLQELETRANS